MPSSYTTSAARLGPADGTLQMGCERHLKSEYVVSLVVGECLAFLVPVQLLPFKKKRLGAFQPHDLAGPSTRPSAFPDGLFRTRPNYRSPMEE